MTFKIIRGIITTFAFAPCFKRNKEKKRRKEVVLPTVVILLKVHE